VASASRTSRRRLDRAPARGPPSGVVRRGQVPSGTHHNEVTTRRRVPVTSTELLGFFVMTLFGPHAQFRTGVHLSRPYCPHVNGCSNLGLMTSWRPHDKPQ